MSVEIIRNSKALKYKDFIPGEFMEGVMTGQLQAIGGFFADDRAGALVYEKEDDLIIIRSIYVAPEFRRLGVGTELFEELPEGKISVTYEAVDDRVTLEPFFEAVDVELERLDVPFADFTVGRARNALKRLNADRAGEIGSFLDELTPSQENVVLSWFSDEFGEEGLDRTTYDSASIFYLEKGEVKGAIFIRRDEPSDYDIVVNGPDSPPDDLLDIDYIFCNSSNKKALPAMMNKLIKRLSNEHKDTSRIQGLIMNDSGLNMYRVLFGDAAVSIPVFVSV